MSLDTTILETIISLRTPMLTSVMFFLTWFGSALGVALVGCVVVMMLYAYHQWRHIVFFLVSLFGSAILTSALKIFFVRDRPALQYALDIEYTPAFPSGHAMVAIALYGALIIILWKMYPRPAARFLSSFVLSSIIFAIGFSRLYLGVHWPTDVLGGYVLGALWLWISYRITKPV